MAEYITTRDIRIPKGTAITYPAPIAKEAVTYGSAVFDPNGTEPDGRNLVTAHFQIPLDEALKAGLVKERE